MLSARRKALLGGAAVAAIVAVVVGLTRGRLGDPPMSPGAVIAVPGAEPRILVAHRSRLGERAELELVRARDGSTIWKTPMPTLGPDARSIAVDEGGIVALAGNDTKLVGVDPASGAVRWQTPFDGHADEMWIHAGVVVVRALATGETPLWAFDLETGQRLWKSALVSSQYAPVFTGEHLVIPMEHTRHPALRFIALRTGAASALGSGLVWPGVATDATYTSIFAPGEGGEPLVTTRLLAFGSPDSGAGPPPLADGSPRVGLVSIDVAKGEMKRLVDLPADADAGSFFARWKDHVLFLAEKETAFVSAPSDGHGESRVLAAPEGYRFWTGGVTHAIWRHREAWPYLAPRTRFVPMVLNRVETDAAKVCVIDLDEHTFTWCAERDIPASNGPWGWLSATTRGTFHFFAIDDALLVLDGVTGKAKGAFTLHSADGKLRGWPEPLDHAALAGEVLSARHEEYAWAVDITTRTLAWQRGPSAITIRDARSTVISALGSVP